MPIFEYVCEKCDHCFEHLSFGSDNPAPACPNCCSPEVKKVMSAGCIRPNGIAGGSGGFKQSSCAPSSGG